MRDVTCSRHYDSSAIFRTAVGFNTGEHVPMVLRSDPCRVGVTRSIDSSLAWDGSETKSVDQLSFGLAPLVWSNISVDSPYCGKKESHPMPDQTKETKQRDS